MDGARRRLDREHDDRAWLAWTTAFLPHSKDVERLRLTDLQSASSRRARRGGKSGWEDEFAAWSAWAAPDTPPS